MRRYLSTDFIMLTLLSLSVCVVRYENSKNQQQWNRTSMFQHTARQQRWVQVFFLFSNFTSSLSSVLSMTSLLLRRTHRYSSTFKETKEELCCVRKNQYFSRFSLFVYLFVFFSVHGHVLWPSLGYAEGERIECACVWVDFSVFFKFGFKLSSGFMLLLSLFLIFQ